MQEQLALKQAVSTHLELRWPLNRRTSNHDPVGVPSSSVVGLPSSPALSPNPHTISVGDFVSDAGATPDASSNPQASAVTAYQSQAPPSMPYSNPQAPVGSTWDPWKQIYGLNDPEFERTVREQLEIEASIAVERRKMSLVQHELQRQVDLKAQEAEFYARQRREAAAFRESAVGSSEWTSGSTADDDRESVGSRTSKPASPPTDPRSGSGGPPALEPRRSTCATGAPSANPHSDLQTGDDIDARRSEASR